MPRKRSRARNRGARLEQIRAENQLTRRDRLAQLREDLNAALAAEREDGTRPTGAWPGQVCAEHGLLWDLLRDIAESDERVWDAVADIVETIPPDKEGREEREMLLAMAAQAAAAHLAGMTPGGVLRRLYQGDCKSGDRLRA